ncbi:MAG TPA: anti-CBASS Acb1 family protein [Steroidobacteraceae bacterium]
MAGEFDSSEVSVSGSNLGNTLMSLLKADDIQPGDTPSYQVCKAIYLSHPLGGKLVDTPISMAQSEPREITVQDAPDEVVQEFKKVWGELAADDHIANVMRLSRIYGIGSLVIGCQEVPSDQPLDMTKIWQQTIFFNTLDPLNTAGSLVLNQVSTAPDFNKPITVSTSGQTYHRSRYQVVMNEAPIFLAYTDSAFGFVGRSVYQRALYPLKSFILTMIADDMIAKKLALLIAKQKSPGSIIDKAMQKIAGLKRAFLKFARSGEVLSIGVDEDVQTLNMQNVDGAGTFARTNIVKNIASAADTPAQLIDEETLAEGFGEGTEDAKKIIRFINGIRRKMLPIYSWFDNIVRYRAWTPEFYARMQRKYPEKYGKVEFADAFSEWRANFAAEFPSLLIEPESEQIKTEEVKLEAIIAILQSLLDHLDPKNKMAVIQWAADNLGENKLLFPHELAIDWDTLEVYQVEQEKRRQELTSQGGGFGDDLGGPVARKLGRFDSTPVRSAVDGLRAAVAKLPPRKGVAKAN